MRPTTAPPNPAPAPARAAVQQQQQRHRRPGPGPGDYANANPALAPVRAGGDLPPKTPLEIIAASLRRTARIEYDYDWERLVADHPAPRIADNMPRRRPELAGVDLISIAQDVIDDWTANPDLRPTEAGFLAELQRRGDKGRATRTAERDALEAQAARLKNDGWTPRRIAAEIGRSLATVYRYLKDAGKKAEGAAAQVVRAQTLAECLMRLGLSEYEYLLRQVARGAVRNAQAYLSAIIDRLGPSNEGAANANTYRLALKKASELAPVITAPDADAAIAAAVQSDRAPVYLYDYVRRHGRLPWDEDADADADAEEILIGIRGTGVNHTINVVSDINLLSDPVTPNANEKIAPPPEPPAPAAPADFAPPANPPPSLSQRIALLTAGRGIGRRRRR